MPLFLNVTECAIRYQDKYLIITRPEGVHAAGLLAFPGGKIELCDAIEESDVLLKAAKREVLEEVGIDLIDPLYYLTTSFFVDKISQTPILDCVFACELLLSKSQVVANAREVPKYQWLTYEQIDQHSHAPSWLKRYVKLAEQVLSDKS